MTAPVKLTEAQRQFLSDCARAPRSPLVVPHYVVDALEQMGLIEHAPGRVTATSVYIATDAGREWLAANGGE